MTMDDFGKTRTAWLLRDYAKSGACGPLRATECEDLAEQLLKDVARAEHECAGRGVPGLMEPCEECYPHPPDGALRTYRADISFGIRSIMPEDLPPEIFPVGYIFVGELPPKGEWLTLDFGAGFPRGNYPELYEVVRTMHPGFTTGYDFRVPFRKGAWIKAR